jgi:hypothetical protein
MTFALLPGSIGDLGASARLGSALRLSGASDRGSEPEGKESQDPVRCSKVHTVTTKDRKLSAALLDESRTIARDNNSTSNLQDNMAAVRVSFPWLGTRKSLTPEQRADAAQPFDAEDRLHQRIDLANRSTCRLISAAGPCTRWPWPGRTHSNRYAASRAIDSACSGHEYQQ